MSFYLLLIKSGTSLAMNRVIFLFFFTCFLQPLIGQINQTDSDGKNHGPWEKRYENGEIQYRGEFSHGEPIGTFERFYDDGILQAVIEYRNSSENYATLYYPEIEVRMAEGRYIDQERDSVWTFYSEEGSLTSKESYQNGEKEGSTEIYYEDGSISERIMFKGDVKNGAWEQYFNNGNPKLKASVINGVKYDGQYTTYNLDGIKLKEGKYSDGKKESSWYIFNEDGSVHIIYVYRDDEIEEEFPKNGTFELFWPNDIKRSEYTYRNGKRQGAFKEWFDKGEWKNEERIDEAGNRYPIQKLHGTQLRREGIFKEGKLHGEIITYGEDGSVKKKATYEMGEIVD
jgi:antitoxin component YwqK of YwqJK toxin-antitoxin module